MRFGYQFKWVAVICLFFGLAGCKKELNEPLQVKMDLSVESEEEDTPEMMQEGTMKMEEMTIVGKRKQGEEVRVSLQKKRNFDLAMEDIDPAVSFDLPEGIYTRLRLDYEMASKGPAGSVVSIKGLYQGSGPGNQKRPFILELDSAFSGSFDVIPPGEERRLAGKGTRDLAVRIGLDTWFEKVEEGHWENAAEQNIGGVPTVVIDHGNNTHIFSRIVKKIPESFKGDI